MIAGPGVYICDECIELCMSILEDEINPHDSEYSRIIMKMGLLFC